MLIELDDRVHGAVDQAAKLLFAVAHLRFGAQTAQLSSRSGGKDLK